MTCRICYEGPDLEQNNRLISVCNCSGSTELVHEECIKKWIIISKKKQCEICHASWRNIELDFLKSAETNLECMPLLGIILGSAVAAIRSNIKFSHEFITTRLHVGYIAYSNGELHTRVVMGIFKKIRKRFVHKNGIANMDGNFFPSIIRPRTGR